YIQHDDYPAPQDDHHAAADDQHHVHDDDHAAADDHHYVHDDHHAAADDQHHVHDDDHAAADRHNYVHHDHYRAADDHHSGFADIRRLPVRSRDRSHGGPHRARDAQARISGPGEPGALGRADPPDRQRSRPAHAPGDRHVGYGCPPRLLQAAALERG